MKSIKDINTKCEDVCPNECEGVKRLRNEAINQYIAYMGEYEEHKEENWSQHDKEIAEYIKHFWNITEDDLKNDICSKP